MAYTTTRNTSYGQRLGGSMKGVGIGIALFIAGTCLLFWNEGNYVKTRKAILESEGVATHVDYMETIDPLLNGKLIHASAFADTKEVLADDLFGVHETAIALKRKVEYYQWNEKKETKTRDKIGGGQEEVTTYTYVSKWGPEPVNSSVFEDYSYRNKNFVITIAENKDWQAENVTFGAYRLPPFIISSIVGDVPAKAQFTPQEEAVWERRIATNMEKLGRKPKATIAPAAVAASADSGSENNVSAANASVINSSNEVVQEANGQRHQFLHVDGNTIYIGQSPDNPHIGDVRVTITKILPADISILAQVNDDTFEKYTARNGKEFSRVEMGVVSMDKMFAKAHSGNSILAWFMRIMGVLLVMFGLKYMFNILPTLFKVLPFLSGIVGAGVGLITFVFGLVWSLLLIAIAWLFYRPLIGIALIVVVVSGILFLKKKAKSKAVQ